MPIFDLGLPDGRTLTLEAPDEQSALSAATEWHAANPATSVAADVGKSAVSGLAQGAINVAGMGGDVRNMLAGAVGLLGGGDAGRSVVDKALRGLPVLGSFMSGPTSQEIKDRVTPITGDFYKPQTTAGKYVKTIGEFAPGAALPGGAVRRALNVVAPAVGSETAGQVAGEGSPAEPYARMGGALAGGMVPGSLARLATPLPSSPQYQNAVNTLRDEGVTSLTPGRVTGSKRMQYFERENGGLTAENMAERANEQFTAAALRRTGIAANRAEPEVLNKNFERIGKVFDDLEARTIVPVDTKLWDGLQKVVRDYKIKTPPSQRVPAIEAIVDDIGGAGIANRGILQGDVYKSLATQIRTLERGASGETKEAWAGIRQALDDAVDRSGLNKADRDAWKRVRREYRNMLVIERAATAPGENARAGFLSPAQLRSAVVNQNRRDFARGRGDFAELVRAGERVLTPLPNSGTPGGLKAQSLGMSMPGAIGTLIGGGLGSVMGGPFGAGIGGLSGAIGGAMLPGAIGRAALSSPGRAWLGNQAMAQQMENAPPWMQAALLQAVLARSAER